MALTRLGLNQSVNLSTNTTGTLGVANGGTGLTSGTTDQFLKFTGSTTVASAAVETDSGLASQQVFTSSGTWTKPTGITKVKVTVIGGGGGAFTATNTRGGGGGAGGTAIEIIDVSSVASVSVTVGAGGAAGSTSGATGSTSSFIGIISPYSKYFVCFQSL